MDLGTIAGIGGGFAMIFFGILTSGGAIGSYVNIPSLIMVLGGSFTAMLVANPLSRMLGFVKYFKIAMNMPNYEEAKMIASLVSFSEKARREGLLALEDDLEEVEEEFLRKGIQLVVDGTDPEVIKSILYNDLNQMQERHQIGIGIFKLWGSLCPAFGMIGTLAGLIAMLANMQDTSAIGSGMALALITTMYGSIFANLLFIPVQNKLQDRDNAESVVKEIMIEGILSIQSGDNPRILEQKLVSFLPPDQREAVLAETSSE
jgi:chemotaxis protein MotA